jgi:succinoglycan biosynthesis transport protein ExoP
MDGDALQRPSLALSDLGVRLYRRRWIIVGCLLVGWTIGTSLGFLLPTKYRSETVILIEQQKVPEHFVEPNVTADLQQRLQNISQRILSRTRLLKLIDKFNLYNAHAGHSDPDVLVEKLRKDIDIELIRSDGRRDDLSAFKVSYAAPMAQLAKDVTSELTSFFIDEDLRTRQQLSEDTTSFLSSQLEEARRSLAEQEQRLREFRGKYLGELPEQLQGNLQILGALQAQLQAATDSLSQAEQRGLYLRSQISQNQVPSSSGKVAVAPEGMTLDQQLESLQSQLREAVGRYTPMHPDILRLKSQIARLEAQKANAAQESPGQGVAASSSDSGTKPTAPENSAPNEWKAELTANAFEIANQKAKVKRLEEQIVQYQGRLNLTPALEQQAAAVTRDYEQSRTYYDSLLAKKLQSEMATNLEKRREGEQFVVIDPPQLPQRPYTPKRVALALGGLAVGLGLGLVIVVLLEVVVAPRIYREPELAEFSRAGFSLSIPNLATDEELRRKARFRIVEGFAGAAICVIVPVVTLVAYYKG